MRMCHKRLVTVVPSEHLHSVLQFRVSHYSPTITAQRDTGLIAAISQGLIVVLAEMLLKSCYRQHWKCYSCKLRLFKRLPTTDRVLSVHSFSFKPHFKRSELPKPADSQNDKLHSQNNLSSFPLSTLSVSLLASKVRTKWFHPKRVGCNKNQLNITWPHQLPPFYSN